jgi:transcriptional pleiotropic regulator of transition state genes
MSRRIDQLGRLVVPAEYRKRMGLEAGDMLDMRVEHGELVISKVMPECAVCGRRDELTAVHDKHICTECTRAIRRDPQCALCQRPGHLVELHGKHVCETCVREISHV